MDGRADLREVLVQPADDVTDVVLSLPETTSCAADGAVCMDDRRKLSNASSNTVAAAVQISVSDKAAVEGDPAIFTVKLNKASTGQVTVKYVTQEASATDGTDYTKEEGALTFTAGDTQMGLPCRSRATRWRTTVRHSGWCCRTPRGRR